MSLLDVALQVAQHEPTEFVCPVPEADEVLAMATQDGIPYRFNIIRPRPGWWIALPDGMRARLIKPAYPHDYLAYLEHLKSFLVIACFRVSESVWMVVPYNAGDAAQRGWLRSEPRKVHLVRHAIQPFDVLIARDLAGVLLYDSVCTRTEDGIKGQDYREASTGLFSDFPLGSAAFRVAGRIIQDRIRAVQREQELRAQQERAERARQEMEARRATTEGSFRWHLEFVGAELLSWNESGNGHIVRWEHAGREYSMRISRDMRIESAGICLDGTDRWHNLSSIVSVMEGDRW